MRYAKIREMDISNGEGIGASLFVQGCHFHCRGCFNQETWDFNGGKEWTEKIEQEFMELVSKPYITRISLLGGEPLADENIATITSLIFKLSIKYPDKKIWVYTGYTFEDIINKCGHGKYDSLRYLAIHSIDVLVDGKFQLENQDLFNKKTKWAGSTNQRVIKAKDYFRGNSTKTNCRRLMNE